MKTKYGTSNGLPLKIESATMLIKPVTITPKPTNQVTPVKVPVNSTAKTIKLSMNPDNTSRLSAEILRGVRVTMTGVIVDASLSAQLESYITGLENIFVVDNQLSLSDSPGNININLKGVKVDDAAIEQIIKLIKSKAETLKLNVSVVRLP